MMGFFQGLCGCFSPELKKNIIDYLSSANLNRQLIEEEKCSEETEAPETSIYAQVKTKSYYFMKLKEEDDHAKNHQKQVANEPLKDNSEEPNYYPYELTQNHMAYDHIYNKKLNTLCKILAQQIGPEYSKIYDSQDELNLKIYCKPEIYPSRRINVYRFCFDIPHTEATTLTPETYLALAAPGNNSHELLLAKKENLAKTDLGITICHRYYKKILVVQQHDFYTAEKCELIEEGKKNFAYSTTFSVKGDWDDVPEHSRGWVHLAGMRASLEDNELEQSTSLRETEHHLHFEAYLNVELDITINANMLKQPIAKEIRTYVQKLVCALTNSDAI